MTYPPKVCTLISKQGVGEEQKEQNLSHTVKLSEMKELPLNEQNTEVQCSHYFEHGGGTGKEYPDNLIKSGTECWNKWYQGDHHKPWAMLKSKQGSWKIRGFGLKSANDCPYRDPGSVRVFAHDTSTNQWVHISTVEELEFSEERWCLYKFALPQIQTCAILFEFCNESHEMQLGQITLYN